MNSEPIATPPSVSWAQRNSRVLLTFNVECDKPEIKFDSRKVYFKGICAPDKKLHEIEIPLFAEIDPEKSVYVNKGRFIDVALLKLKNDEPFWPALTSDKKKHHWLKVDFERWQDEDESGDDNDMNDMFSDMKSGLDFGDDNEKDESSSEEDEDLPDVQ